MLGWEAPFLKSPFVVSALKCCLNQCLRRFKKADQLALLESTSTGCPKKCTNRTESQPEMSVMGLNFTIDMTWVRLIQLSLSKKNQTLDAWGASKW